MGNIELAPAVVYYCIPVIENDIIYSKKVILKEFDNQVDAKAFVESTRLSYAAMVGWDYKEDFESRKDKLIRV